MVGAVLAMGVAVALFLPAAEPENVGRWMAEAGLEPRHVEVDGLRLRYVRAGSGPPVLLLHGFVSSIYSWKEIIPELAERHEVVALDLPPFGGSEIPAELSPTLYEDLVPHVLDALGLDRIAIVGNSLGGAVAIVTAVRHPSRVERLALIDPAGFNFDPAERPWLLRLVGSPVVSPVVGRLPVRRAVVSLGLQQVLHDDDRVTRERVDEYLAPLLRPRAVGAAIAVLRERQALGFPAIVSEVRQPTLVIWGAEDTWIPPAHGRRFEEAIRGSRLVTLPGCGHVPQEECADRVLQHLVPFLAAAHD